MNFGDTNIVSSKVFNRSMWQKRKNSDFNRVLVISADKNVSLLYFQNLVYSIFWGGSIVASKFSKPGFNSMWTQFQMFKLDLEKAEEPEIILPKSVRSSKKQKSSRKISTSALLTTPKPLTVWVTTNCGKFWKRWEYQITLPAVCRLRSNS